MDDNSDLALSEEDAPAILESAVRAVNSVFLLWGVKDLIVTDNLYTVMGQHIRTAIRKQMPKRPKGRPKRVIPREKGTSEDELTKHILNRGQHE